MSFSSHSFFNFIVFFTLIVVSIYYKIFVRFRYRFFSSSICMSVRLSVCLFVCMIVYICVCLSDGLYVCLFVFLSTLLICQLLWSYGQCGPLLNKCQDAKKKHSFRNPNKLMTLDFQYIDDTFNLNRVSNI